MWGGGGGERRSLGSKAFKQDVRSTSSVQGTGEQKAVNFINNSIGDIIESSCLQTALPAKLCLQAVQPQLHLGPAVATAASAGGDVALHCPLLHPFARHLLLLPPEGNDVGR